MKRTPKVSGADASIAGRVRYLRVQAGLSRSHLAIAAGVSDGWLSGLEQGRIEMPDPRKLAKLAPILHTTYADLMEAAGYLPLPDMPPELRDFVVILAGMRPFERNKILRMLYILMEPDERPPTFKRPEWVS